MSYAYRSQVDEREVPHHVPFPKHDAGHPERRLGRLAVEWVSCPCQLCISVLPR